MNKKSNLHSKSNVQFLSPSISINGNSKNFGFENENFLDVMTHHYIIPIEVTDYNLINT